MVEKDGLYLFYNGAASSLFWLSNDSPLPLISNTEVRFLEAETELRAGSDAPAISALQAAITANMEQSAALLMNNGISKMVDFRLQQCVLKQTLYIWMAKQPLITMDFILRWVNSPPLAAKSNIVTQS